MFRFIFREKDGNIPTISFEKEANLDGCEFEFDIKNAKAKHTLSYVSTTRKAA
ncbi:MAG: hypothetical protein ACLUKN_15450 [Bacilli bacterium]